MVYIREAHTAESWESGRNSRDGIVIAPARSETEKRGHAQLCLRKLHFEFPAVVDGLDGAVEQAYSAWPSRAVLVGVDGRIVFITRLTELDFVPAEMRLAMDRALQGEASSYRQQKGLTDEQSLNSSKLCAHFRAVPFCDRAAAQTPPTPVEGSFKGGASEVLLDVVVRDKHGKSITDLSQSDFEDTLDNGAAKKIASFRLVSGKQAISGGGTRADLDPLRQIRLITLIFQVSDLQSRKLSRDAAIDLLKTELPQNVYMAVLTIDHNLEALQSFTNDRALLRKAIDRANSADSTDFTSDTNRIRDELQQIVGANVSGANSLQGQVSNMSSGATAVTGQGAAPNPGMVANQLMAQMMLNMLQAQEGMVTAESGRASIYALLQAVRDRTVFPGAKWSFTSLPDFGSRKEWKSHSQCH